MNKSSIKIAHISDIHWRGLIRHDEYKKTFENFFDQVKVLNPDIILIGGDIVHSKTQGITPELIDSLNWWFSSLSQICDVHIILGNHDGNLLNLSRQDSISPIINALNNDKIFLYKDSGNYPIKGFPGFTWGVFSCFDEKNWKNVKPVDGQVNIALYHGAVRGSFTDVSWEISGEVDVSFFDGWDFGLLGDIHKFQFLNEKRTVAYPGSTIMQNYGESGSKGFLFWNINLDKTFDVDFHEIQSISPFVTLDWKGDVKKTIWGCSKKYPPTTRFRIKSTQTIPQIEMHQLQNELKDRCQASEVIFKIDDPSLIQQPIANIDQEVYKENLRDPDVLIKLLKAYFENDKLNSKEWSFLEDIIKDYLKRIRKSDSIHRNTKWSLERIKFDNTFCFGENNVIDFSKTKGGITGVFGQNAQGKSSIMASIMYALFNGSDRGAVKNFDIVNIRKDYCSAYVDLKINSELYRIERQTVKNQTKKGEKFGITSLNFYKISEDGEKIDLCGEQRTETEKVIRNLIGSPEDFLLTSFASQGNINTFIKEGATNRKKILTKFLDLDIFDQMLEYIRDDSNELKGQIKNAPDRDWDTIINENKKELNEVTSLIDLKESDLRVKRADLQQIQARLVSLQPSDDIVTISDVKRQENAIKDLEDQMISYSSKLVGIEGQIIGLEMDLDKIAKIKNEFPLEELKEKINQKKEIINSLQEFKMDYEKENEKLNQKIKSIDRLKDIPCNDQYPTCIFIKNSHKDKNEFNEQKEKVDKFLKMISIAEEKIKEFEKENLESKMEKYQSMLLKETNNRLAKSEYEITKNKLTMEIDSLENKIETFTNTLNEMKEHMSDIQEDDEINRLKDNAVSLTSEINKTDSERLSLAEKRGQLLSYIALLKDEKKKYGDLRLKWNLYELFSKAISKNGIPAQIIGSQLPIINREIDNILTGIVDFTVDLEVDDTGTNNSMEVYINYGDSRRVIETASGMEKMISSLAIRVALINVSSIPKTDMFIIDEGFGVLDDSKVASINLFLQSLNRWFKNILIISHVDSVKDVADNIIEIERFDKDSHVCYE